MQNVPDIEWYSRVSIEKGLTTRCPFAAVEACPRYYQSLSLAAKTGATEIPPKEDKRLLKKWEASDLWPRTHELSTSVSSSDSKLSMLSNFCPEVTFERFGYFCTFLSSYSDEIDSDAAHGRLVRSGAKPNDPGWRWQGHSPQHYSDCPIYSVLHHRSTTASGKVEASWWREHLAELIVGIVVVVVSVTLTKILS